MAQVTIDYKRCNEDGICAEVCPRKLIEIFDGAPRPAAGMAQLCIQCGHCMAVCPQGAVSISGVGSSECPKIDRAHWPTYEQLDHLMRSRRSVRRYKDKPVESDIINRILETCRYAPSGSNAQPVHWIIAGEPDSMREIGQLAVDWMAQAVSTSHPLAAKLPLAAVVEHWKNGEDRIFRGAPMAIMTHAPKVGSLPLESCVIAMTYFDLVAAGMGLATCWVGLLMVAAAEHTPIGHALGIPADHMLFGAMIMGYPQYKYQRIPPRHQPRVKWL